MKKSVLLVTMVFLACAGFRPVVLDQYESNKASEIYQKGNEHFKNKEYEEAIKELEIILQRYEKTEAFEPSLYITAFSYYKLNKYKEAAALGEKFVQEFPVSDFFLNAASLVGESYYKLNENYKAAYYLAKFFTDSEDSDLRKKALRHILDILPKLALKELEKLHRTFISDPVDEHILYNLAQIEARDGKKEEAERDFNLLTRRFPKTVYTMEVQEYQRYIDLGETSNRAGVILPLSGKWADIGQKLVEIMEMFERESNLPFTIHYLDTRSDPVDATLAAGRLINDMNVDFIICLTSIYNAFGVCGLAYGRGIPVILPMTSEARLEQIPLVYTTGQRQDEQARIVARYAMANLRLVRFAVLYPDIVKFKVVADAFASEVARLQGEVVTMISFDPDSITLKWELMAIKEKRPQAIFLPMDKDMLINTAPQIAYYGLLNIQLLGIDTFKDEKVPRLGEKYVEKAIFASAAPIDSATLEEYHRSGYKDDDLTAKFFYTLWQLRELKNYNRSILPKLISDILKERKISYIYQVRQGEFFKLAEITE